MNTDDLLAACEHMPKWLAKHGAEMLRDGMAPKDAADLISDMTAICTALPLLVARVRELEAAAIADEPYAPNFLTDADILELRKISLDHRIKIAFAEMEIAWTRYDEPMGDICQGK